MLYTMNRKPILTFLLVFFSTCVCGVYNLDYSDLEALGQTCSPRDTCEGYTRRQSFYDRNCECDSACASYEDCCIDSPFRPTSSSRTSPRNGNNQNDKICLQFGDPDSFRGVFVVRTCKRNWNGAAQVRQKCQGHNDFTDPLNSAPVVDTQRRVAYKNRYCSECNNVPPSRLVSFNVALNCETLPLTVTESYILSNLEYNATMRKWGVSRWNPNLAENEFHACDLYFNSTVSLENSVRLCRAKMVSTCPSTWTRAQIKRSCESYQAVVKGTDDKLYKNPHCALCNGLTVEQYACVMGDVSGKKKPMSFALLLDVNQSDGDEVGVSRRGTPSCSANQKYDPFFKKCRALVCALPGHVMVNGRCARPS